MLVWLASYPKSGNTWMRMFLAAYNRPTHGPLDINHNDNNLHAGTRDLFDRVIGLEASDMTPAETRRYRPYVHRQLAAEASGPLFVKVHDRWHVNDDGAAIFPAEATAATIYIVRDPRAVAPSFASHYNVSIDAAIDRMADVDHGLCAPGNRLRPQLHQPTGSWSQHVASWLDQPDLPVHLVRYEDLHARPAETFAAVVKAAGLALDAARLQAALEMSRFERLQEQEDSVGFRERLAGSARFFRRGRVDGWRDELTTAQAERIVAAHGPVMTRLGYLDGRARVV